MSAPLYLCSEDFYIGEGTKGPILCNKIRDFSLILFYSPHCEGCKTLLPIFKNSLPGTVMGCQFGLVNVSSNRKCIEDSKKTIAPIRYVPYIVLYINGKPYVVYNGSWEYEAISRFVIEVANNIQKNQTFSKGKVQENPNGLNYWGIPIKGNDKVCYLEYNSAYVTQR